MQSEIAAGFEGRKLITFFKGTAGDFLKLRTLAPSIMAAAAHMRNTVARAKKLGKKCRSEIAKLGAEATNAKRRGDGF